jgi:hypothetical protein
MKVRFVLMLGAIVCAFLAYTGVALAASSQDIYNDYMDNGRLDGNYTDAELQAFLGDASLHQYGDPTIVSSLDTAVSSMLSSETDGRHSFPFTGAQLALMGFGALALIGSGVGLRRLAHTRS